MEIIIRISPEEFKEILGEKKEKVQPKTETITFSSGEHKTGVSTIDVQQYINSKDYWEKKLNHDKPISPPMFGAQTRQ